MKEIEAKFKLAEDVSFDLVVEKFSGKYNFSREPRIQQDSIYLFPEQIDRPIVTGSKIARVRIVTQGSTKVKLLTLKVQTEKAMVSDEYEIEISNAESAQALLVGLGMEHNVSVRKKRVEFKTDEYTVCVDEVDKLGVFIELEILANARDDLDIDVVQLRMKQYLNKLGLKGEINMTPYDTQVKNYDESRA